MKIRTLFLFLLLSVTVASSQGVDHSLKIAMVKNKKTFADFLTAIGHRESGNKYNMVNPYGYLGKYQFNLSTLNWIGIKTTSDEFLLSPKLQEAAMRKLLKRNKTILSNEITEYHGKTIDSVEITESGILAAAHLAGAGNVKKFFKEGIDKRDKNGIKMTHYMEKFSGYDIKLK